MTTSSAVSTFLWFDSAAEEAATFYTSLLPNSEITGVTPGPDGKAFVVTFTLDGQQFTALNAGPHHTFSEAISVYVSRKDQHEVDTLWEALTSNGGEAGPCGWLKDRFGLSWQVVPEALPELMSGDPAKSAAVGAALRTMSRIDIAALRAAYESA